MKCDFYCNILFATVIVAGDVFVVVAAYPDNCASFIANKKELPFFSKIHPIKIHVHLITFFFVFQR